jgi:hypothetical protein
MANEVEKTGVFGNRAAMVNTEALKEAMQQSSQADPRGAAADGSDYMNFSGKRGVYEIGKEKRDTTEDELWLVNVPAFEDGWICWKGGRVMANRLVPLGQPIPSVDQEEHGPFPKDGDGWYQAKSMTIRSIDSGQQCYFKINSVSGVSVFASLQKEITARLMAGQPYWPVISLGRESFTAQGYKNSKPIIKVDGWLSDEQVINQLPLIFEDEDAEIDLEEMYAAANGAVALPHDGETEVEEAPTKVARRNRRSV